MRAGMLRNDFISLYALEITKDEYGAEVETYTLLFDNVRCNVSGFSENRGVDNEEVTYTVYRRFTVRRNYKSSLNEHCRLKYNDVWYLINSIDISKDNNNIVITAIKVND